jgi:tetratricopeptide (TPR) repeat protein
MSSVEVHVETKHLLFNTTSKRKDSLMSLNLNATEQRKLLLIDRQVQEAVNLKRQGRLLEAQHLLEACIGLYKEDTPILLAPAFKSLAKILYIQGRYLQAEGCYVEAIQRYQTVDSQDQIMECLIHLGCCSDEFRRSKLLSEYVLGLEGKGVSQAMTDPDLVERLIRLGSAKLLAATHKEGSPRSPAIHRKRRVSFRTGRNRFYMSFCGKRLVFTRAPMSINPGETPPLLTDMDILAMPCLLGRYHEKSQQIQECRRGLWLPLGLAPSVFLCPNCYGLMFIDRPDSAGTYPDADLTFKPNTEWSLFGYATYPTANDHSRLVSRIRARGSGGIVLLPQAMTEDAERAFGLTDGKYMLKPGAVSREELALLGKDQAELAYCIVQEAMVARSHGRHREAFGLAQRALAIHPENEGGNFLLRQYLS